MYLDKFFIGQQLFYSYWEDQYIYLIFYIFISFLLTTILFIVGFSLSPKEVTFEKTSSYECGFEPFGDAHSIFNIQFFVVGILFMLFDLELAYLFPWVLCLGSLSLFSFFLMFFFLILFFFFCFCFVFFFFFFFFNVFFFNIISYWFYLWMKKRGFRLIII